MQDNSEKCHLARIILKSIIKDVCRDITILVLLTAQNALFNVVHVVSHRLIVNLAKDLIDKIIV